MIDTRMGVSTSGIQPETIGPPFQQPADAVVAALNSDAQNGLTAADAKARLEIYGPNEIARERRTPWWTRFLAQFKNVLVVLLLIATAISLALWVLERRGDGGTELPYEAIAILAVVLLNALMGFIQESRAASAVEALRAMTASQVTVMRDGQRQRIAAAELVPGDIMVLEEGDAVAADGRIIRCTALNVAEAALTGESMPVTKDSATLDPGTIVPLGDRTNMVYAGTAVTYGRGRVVVTATGMNTEMGRIAGMLQETRQEPTPLQVELNRVGRLLGLIVIAIAVIMVVTIILVEQVRGLAAVLDVLILGVALAVAAVPEGLPAVVTAVLALGMQRMASRRAIVRQLAAVETLGSATVIASDKTGTLTRNEMTVKVVVTASGRAYFEGSGYVPEGKVSLEQADPDNEPALREELWRALTVADLANNAQLIEREGRWMVQGDPTEGALLVAARKAGLTDEALDARFKRLGEVPFSSERRLMSTVHADVEREPRVVAFIKGAPDVLVSRCTHEFVGSATSHHLARTLTDERRAEILQLNEELAGQALRTLAVAYRTLHSDQANSQAANVPIEGEFDERIEHDLVFLGLIGMYDPPRDEARAAVEKAKRAGIRPMMVTGDHPKTAAVIALDLGIASTGDGQAQAVTGAELLQMSDDELVRTVGEVNVYARVEPEHKLRIVQALKRRGETVAMTGDGVNDAPALNAADIGVAMGITGTDVSKQAADVILTDDNFATIVAAVEQGRAIFDNIRKFLRYLLSSNIGEVMTMFLGVVLASVIGLETAGEAIALPLLATQILWINLVTDGAPALALGIDPPADDVMQRKPRPRSEAVITAQMWRGIFFVGAIMAVGTLLVLDIAMPGGLIEGSGDLRFGQTMAFNTLMLFQLFNVLNARSDTHSAFRRLFANGWLWTAIGLSLLLQFAVIYTPFLQRAFSTVSLAWNDWLLCAAVASSVLWLREASKCIARKMQRD